MIKVINGVLSIKVDKAQGIWAIIQYCFWRSVGGRDSNRVETAMVDVFRKKVVTRRGDDGWIPVEMYKHELVHLQQIEKYGRFLFIILFLCSSIYNTIKYLSFYEGYKNNYFEVQARELADSMVI